MEKFSQHTGVGVPLRRSNVDTDQIIPAVYLKRVTRTGFEDALFAAWRGDPEFVLNQPRTRTGPSSSPGRTSAPAPSPRPPGGGPNTSGFPAATTRAFPATFPGDPGN